MSIENININEISDDQLDNVSGGSDWATEKSEYLPAGHGRHIGKYDAEAYIMKKVYAVNDQRPDQYCFGFLESSYEKDDGCDTDRMHKIYVLNSSCIWTEYDHNGITTRIKLRGNVELPGDYFTLFLEK